MLEEKIQELTDAINRLNATISDYGQKADKPKTKKETKKPETKKEVKKETAPEPPAKEDPPARVTVDTISALCRQKNKENPKNKAKIKAIVAKHGGRLINHLKPDVYHAVVDELEAL